MALGIITHLTRALAHPLARDLAIDDPRTTAARRRIIRTKPALASIYADWYRSLAGLLPTGAGSVLEIGSGAGFLRRFVPGLIASDIFAVPGNDLVCDGCRLPFADRSLRAIILIDALHHIPGVERFLAEADRCLRPGGKLLMIEPWNTPWSRLVFKHLHHEPFRADASDWSIPSSGPLSGANGALPWIIFSRDRARFEASFPNLRIERIAPLMPFRYLFSGGVSLRPLLPSWIDASLRRLENDLGPLARRLAMFALIEISAAPPR